jgi:hypothetical protein
MPRTSRQKMEMIIVPLHHPLNMTFRKSEHLDLQQKYLFYCRRLFCIANNEIVCGS